MTKEEKRIYDQERYLTIRADPEWLSSRREQGRVASLRYYYRNREKQIAKSKAWAKRNPEKHKAQKRRWYHAHRDERVTKARARYWKNVDRNRASCRDWYAAHKEYAKVMARAWQLRNKDRLSHYANKRRVRQANNGGSHTLEEWKNLCLDFGGKCFYCQADRPLTRDHLIPVSRGGSDDIENIVPACRPCNASKSTLTFDEYMNRQQTQ